MANLPESESDEPVPAQDKLVFTTAARGKPGSGAYGSRTIGGAHFATQGDDGHYMAGKKTYRIMDSLVVEEGKTLTLAAGTRLYFHDKAELKL